MMKNYYFGQHKFIFKGQVKKIILMKLVPLRISIKISEIHDRNCYLWTPSVFSKNQPQDNVLLGVNYKIQNTSHIINQQFNPITSNKPLLGFSPPSFGILGHFRAEIKFYFQLINCTFLKQLFNAIGLILSYVVSKKIWLFESQ